MRILILNIIVTLTLFSADIFGQIDINQSKYFKALYYYENNLKDSALVELKFCRSEPQCAFFEAKILFEKGCFTEATSIYKDLLDKEPSESSFYLSLVYADMGFAEESVMWLEKYFEHKDPRFYSQIISNKEFENILRTPEWRGFWEVNRYSKNTEKYEEAIYLINTQKYENAISLISNIDGSSRSYLKNYLLALAYFESGNIKNANKYINLSVSSNSKNVNVLELKLKILKENKDYVASYDLNNNLLKIDKYDPQHILNQAEICYLLSYYDEAEKYIKEYVKYFIDNEKANFLKAQILTKQQKLSEALITLNHIIEKNPSVTEYFNLRADIYSVFESWNFAANDYSMVLDIDPVSPDTYYKIGICYFKLNQMEKACYAWKKATGLKNKDAKKMLNKYCDF